MHEAGKFELHGGFCCCQRRRNMIYYVQFRTKRMTLALLRRRMP
jgi:hypothetical protein